MASSIRPMNIIEKILLHHAVGLSKAEVTPGDVICVKCDWVMANELTLVGISDMYKKFGKPGVFNKERVWLAVDHTVDPRINDQPKPQALIKLSDEFAQETGITDYWPQNTTIMHTEFARQRSQPGQIVIGADSHTCSAGGMGAFACGLGAADVTVPLVTGQTWFQVPQTLLIEFTGEPKFGVGGKDIILHVLGTLKRNTVALDRAVEFRGPGLAHLSSDARFAISNMTTEFGGIVGVFEADEITARTLAGRAAHKSESLFFRADPEAQYSDRFTIDLGDVQPQVALFPSPDNCKPVTEVAGLALDGCFIGACTTTQEDLILGALVLEAAMKAGRTPAPARNGSATMRRVTPGSLAIVEQLKSHGLIEIYERAGFVVGVPGCSYCLGIAADVAGDGEVWLSSQNRNFKNRMGKGSIANLASAAVVAASSFDFTVTDPSPFLAAIEPGRYDALRAWIPSAASCHSSSSAAGAAAVPPSFTISEPAPVLTSAAAALEGSGASESDDPAVWNNLPSRIKGRVQRFGDGVDTDAIIPASFMGCSPADMVRYGGRSDMTEDEFLGAKCFGYVRPEFSGKVAQGFNVVVAESGFGCGSSREEAVRSLVNSGVKAVFAKSFAFIYMRNQPNFSLLGGIVKDDRFYASVGEGSEVEVDVGARRVIVHAPDGSSASYPFALSRMEERFLQGGGVEKLYKAFRRELFKAVLKAPPAVVGGSSVGGGCGDGDCGPAAPQAAEGASLKW